MLKIKLSLPPTLNHTYRVVHKGMIKTKDAKSWQEYAGLMVIQELQKKGLEADLRGDYHVTMDLYLKRSRDVDSSIKLLLDALEGVIWKNDKQVQQILVRKWKTSNEPCLELEIKNANTDIW